MRQTGVPVIPVAETLRPLAERALRSGGLRLSFPPALEDQFRRDRNAATATHLRNVALCTLPLYLAVVAFSSLTFGYLHDAKASILLCLVVTATCLLALPYFRTQRRSHQRNLALIAFCLVLCLAPILFVALEPREPTLEDLVLSALPLSFVLLFCRPPFAIGAALAAVTTLAYVALILSLPITPLPALCAFLIGIMVLQAMPFLLALHSLERSTRRLYLHGLIQRMNFEHAAIANAALETLSYSDPLTGVANRRRLDADLARLCARAEGRASFVLLDIDLFKCFNDFYGHPMGDQCLKEVARCLTGALRGGDLLYRLGSEEFGVILPGLAMQEAASVAERLRRSVAGFPIMIGAEIVCVTVSAGVSGIVPHDDPDRVLETAGQALQRAKRAGRNQVGGPWTKETAA